jgi:hypothetical protein
MRLRISLLIVAMLSCFGCDNPDHNLVSRKYVKPLGELTDLPCDEYAKVAVCEAAAHLYNVGHFGASEYKRIKDGTLGEITITTIFGDMSVTVTLQCGVEPHIKELIRIDSEKGNVKRFTERITPLGHKEMTCRNL